MAKGGGMPGMRPNPQEIPPDTMQRYRPNPAGGHFPMAQPQGPPPNAMIQGQKNGIPFQGAGGFAPPAFEKFGNPQGNATGFPGGPPMRPAIPNAPPREIGDGGGNYMDGSREMPDWMVKAGIRTMNGPKPTNGPNPNALSRRY